MTISPHAPTWEQPPKVPFATKQKKKGLWILGASWWDPVNVDAFVFLTPKENKRYLALKKEPFQSDYYERELAPYIKNARKLANQYNIPIFKRLKDAVQEIGGKCDKDNI